MKNSSVVFFTDHKENHSKLIELLDINTNLTVCSYSSDSWDNVDFYSKRNICFVIDEMPQDKDAIWIISKLSEDGLFAEVPILFTTFNAMYEFDKSGFASFAYDVLPEPFDYELTYRRLMNIAEIRQLKYQIYNLTQIHTKRILNQANKLKEQNTKMQTMNYDLVELLVAAIESRDLGSGQHIKRIRLFTKALTDSVMELFPEYGISKEQAEYIYYASSVHDIGKIAIPDAIMLKPGRLTPEEFEIMKTHTVRGYKLLNMLDDISTQNEYFKYCQEICHYHHERWDGRGYPEGLKGDETPISAQIVAVCDCYDALTSHRPYKTALSHQDAVDLIMSGGCGEFSPQMLKAFDASLNKFAKIEREFKAKEVEPEELERVEYTTEKAVNSDKSTKISSNIQESEERILSSHDLIFEADIKNGYFSVLRGMWTWIFPYVPKNFTEVISQCLKMCHPADAARFATKINIPTFRELCKQGKRKTRVEFRLIKDGIEHLVVGVIVFVTDSEKELIGINGFFNVYDDDEILDDIKRGFGVTDTLTGLSLQKQFEQDVNSYIKHNPDSKNLLIHIDIDNMSLCNNFFGYEYGNALIKEFASLLKGITGKDKIVCKAASDKFLLFVRDITNQAEVLLFVENLHNLLRKPYTTAKESGVFTASLGISRYPNDGNDFKSLAIAAEYAAKTAKMNGPGSYSFFNNNMQSLANFGADELDGKSFTRDDYGARFIPVMKASTGELVCYDYVPYTMHDESGSLTAETYYDINKNSPNSKNLSILSVKALMFSLIRLKREGHKIPPISVYTTLTADGLPGFVQELRSTTSENDCTGIELCILLPQDILEEVHINKIKSFSEYLHSIGFKIGLYLLGDRYIHNGCHTHGVFDRFVMKTQYVEHSVGSGNHLQYCVETLNVLHKFVDDVAVPTKVDESDVRLMFNAGVRDFSYGGEPVTGERELIDDFKYRTLIKKDSAKKRSRISEINPVIVYHDIIKSNTMWILYDVRKKSFCLSSNVADVLGDNVMSRDGFSVEHLRDKIHPDDLDNFNDKISSLRCDLGVVAFDVRVKLNPDDGDYTHLLTTIIGIADDSGAPIRFQCSITKLN